MDWNALRADSASVVATLLGGFDSRASHADLPENLDELVLRFTVIAGANLLLDGESQKFYISLCRAAENGYRIQALLAKRGDGLPSAPNNLALLAALVTGHFALAHKVAGVSRTTPNPDAEEYEGESHWATTLRLLAVGATSSVPAAPAPLQKEDAYGDRVAMVQALLAADGPAYLAALTCVQQACQQDVTAFSSSTAPETSLPALAPWPSPVLHRPVA